MTVALWIAQILLAAVFLFTGFMKVTQPRDRLVEMMRWPEDFSDGVVRFIGAMEFLAGLGLILPGATGVIPVLTPLAASGLAIIQIGATQVHSRRGEMPIILGNLVLIAVAVFVAWGRFGPYSFE